MRKAEASGLALGNGITDVAIDGDSEGASAGVACMIGKGWTERRFRGRTSLAAQPATALIASMAVAALASLLICALFGPHAWADEAQGIDSCVGMTAAEARGAAEREGLNPQFRSLDGKDVTGRVMSGDGDAAVRESRVTSASRTWHLFGPDSADFTLDYSVIGSIEGCVGKTALDAKSVCDKCGYACSFKDPYNDDVTEYVTNENDASGASDAEVTSVDVSDGFLFIGP